MAHLFALDFKVLLRGLVRFDFCGEALGDTDACGFKRLDLFRVVGDESDPVESQLCEDGGGQAEVAVVGAVAQLEVGFDGVEALVLQLVGTELCHEADAAAFLLFIQDEAGAVGDDCVEREVKLLAAVTAERVENIAGEALGVDADDGRGSGEIGVGAVAENDGFFHEFALRSGRGAGGERALKAEDAEVATGCGKGGFGDLDDAAVHGS